MSKFLNKKNQETIISVLLGLGILIITSLILSAWMPLIKSFRIVFGSAYILFLPGFSLSYLFFRNTIDGIERFTLSFAISIAVVPLFVFYLSFLGMPINALNISLIVAVITLIGFAIYDLFPPNKKTKIRYPQKLASKNKI